MPQDQPLDDAEPQQRRKVGAAGAEEAAAARRPVARIAIENAAGEERPDHQPEHRLQTRRAEPPRGDNARIARYCWKSTNGSNSGCESERENRNVSARVPARMAGADAARAIPSLTACATPPFDRCPTGGILQQRRYNRPLGFIHTGVIDGNSEGTDQGPALRARTDRRGGRETGRRSARFQDCRRGGHRSRQGRARSRVRSPASGAPFASRCRTTPGRRSRRPNRTSSCSARCRR